MFALLASVLLLYSVRSFWSVQRELLEAEKVLSDLRQEEAALSRENRSLRLGLEQGGREDAVREIAREELGLVLPEDRIYIVGDE